MLGDIDWCGGGNGGPAGAVLSLEDIASAAHFYYVEKEQVAALPPVMVLFQDETRRLAAVSR